jgi:two-component system sensor histidine kinase KdpD
MPRITNRAALLVIRHLAAMACVALTTYILRLFEPFLEIQLIALLFLLPVLISTVYLGLTPGILASFLAFLAFNYYFIEPYHTFQVHKTQDLITLIIFLIVAVILSQLIGQAREGVRLARSREWEATRMYMLISTLAGLPDTRAIARALASHTQRTFGFDRVQAVIDRRNDEPSYTVTIPEGSTAVEPAAMRVPMLTVRGQEGELLIWHSRSHLTTEERRLMEAYTSQGALALERIRLAKSEQKAHVLEDSDRLKSSLLNSVSHELRSPLAAIKASVSSLRTGMVDWDSEAREDLLSTIEEETDHLNQLVGNLLDMSRIEAGALKPQKRWNTISEIIRSVAAKMRKHLQEHQLEIDFPDSLPLIPTDYVMIEQVFTNLISNSIKYAPPGTVIAISGREEGDFVHIEVANQGPPVPAEHLERIFDKFYRITDADRVTGTGLGLSICKGIIEAHGGKIWAENRDSTFAFQVILPIKLDGALPEIPKESRDG